MDQDVSNGAPSAPISDGIVEKALDGPCNAPNARDEAGPVVAYALLGVPVRNIEVSPILQERRKSADNADCFMVHQERRP